METSRKNKRTYCSPKPRAAQIPCTVPSNTTDQTKTPPENPEKQLSKNATKRIQNLLGRKQINYKIQNYAKTLSEIPERISRERNKDHHIFAAANAQIFQAKVTYFPGKNLNDIRDVLSNEIDGEENAKPKIDCVNFKGRSHLPEKDKTFGKHLIGPKKKKLKKMKITPKTLNTIEEVNENERSKESIRKDSQKEINISQKQISDDRPTTDGNFNKKGQNSFITPENVYGQTECVSYSFHGEHPVKIENLREEIPKPSTVILQKDKRNVLQIRDMFERMSKKTHEKQDTKHSVVEPINFEHTISCEECKSILRELMNINEEAPNSTRRIVDSLVEKICERSTDTSDISLKIETKNTTTVSKISYRRCRRRTRRRGDDNDMQYKNFFLLALALSIVLYCFYCRLNEKE